MKVRRSPIEVTFRLGTAADAADIAAWEAALLACLRRRDWHGVSDAANEIRVLEAIRDAKAKP